MNRNTIASGVLALLALLALAWWLGWFHREDPLIVQTRAIMDKPREEQNKDDQNALRNAWQDRMKGMTEEQRQAMFETMMPVIMPLMMRQFETQYDKFMAMSPQERQKELDKRIDEMQKRMAAGGGTGPGGGGGGPGGGGRGGPPNMDPKKMAEFQKKMLAWTTPDQRAKMDNGMQMYVNRMKERGITPPPMPGGGFF